MALITTCANAARVGVQRGNASMQSTQPAPAKSGGDKGRARAAASKGVVFNTSAKVNASAAAQISDDPCKMEYWGCMDMFCMSENDSGGRCACSNDVIKLDKEYYETMSAIDAEIGRNESLAARMELGDEGTLGAPASRTGPVKMECDDPDDIACKIGAAKYNAATKICETEVSEKCRDAHAFSKLQYAQNVRTDCAAYQNAIKNIKEKGAIAASEARRQTRQTALEQFEANNKYDASECRIELRACMNGTSVCGADWGRCAGRDIVEFKYHCEKILDNCKAVRDSVWEGFVADIGPTLRSFQLNTENASRQNCVGRISDCIVKACRDDIAGKGESTMDGCLSRPEMARGFCKVELDECDANGMLWTFVTQKLAAMRTDRCTEEVKECLSNENVCGSDYGQCLGMDIYAIRRMCPVDKLVVCKQDNPNFSIADVDQMITGIFLNIDNKQYDDCQRLADEKMVEICGSTVNCDKFVDEKIGTKSLRYQEIDGTMIISGKVNWGLLNISAGSEWNECIMEKKKDCDKFAKPGTIMISEYMEKMEGENPAGVPDAMAKASNESAIAEISSVMGEINRVIGLIEQDQKIGWCVNGRDLSQVTGQRGMTAARFPLLLQLPRQIIAEAALRRVIDNHNLAVQKMITEAQKTADARQAEYMCYAKPLATTGRNPPPPGTSSSESVGGYGSVQIIGKTATQSEIANMSGVHVVEIDSILTKQITAAWNGNAKTCRICVIDQFKGKRKYVDPRVNETEALKKAIEEVNNQKDNEVKTAIIASGAVSGLAIAAVAGVGIAAAVTAATAATAVATATAAAAGLTAMSLAAGTAAASTAIATGAAAMSALGTAAAASAAVPVVGWVAAGVIATAALVTAGILSAERADPMEDKVDRKIDYCVDEEIGK